MRLASARRKRGISADRPAPVLFLTPGLLLFALVCTGCTSTSTASETLSMSAESSPPVATGTAGADRYPDFSRPLAAAMKQMSDEEARQMSAEISALDQGRVAGSISEAEYLRRVRELEELARLHGQQTISQIEAE
jgi:hypothetical protein